MRLSILFASIIALASELIPSDCFGQRVFITNDRSGNINYLGLANSISIVVEGHSCKSIVAKVKNGSIEKTEDCRFNYWPNKTGYDTIIVFAKKGNRLVKIDETLLRIREIPIPVAMVGGYTNADSVSIGAFRAQEGVGAYLNCCPIHLTFTVTHFHLMVIRNGKTIFEHESQNNKWTQEMKSYFQQLEIGDKILIADIMAKGYNGKDSNLLPVQYTLK